ncbi:MAG: DEAD/DEAH box helicase, partial [Ruaniaceae bacterium]|nr:DEAD/DEAH box helicase [Ruaniaceae bacterium]
MRLDDFRANLPFELDEFQTRACEALERGAGVLVAAPTGSGKTVIAHYGVALAVARGQRAFYTTPIKALSNQKYHELKDQYDVGLLTGDVSINPDAAVIVMTTEVLRNMLYNAPDAVDDVGLVVMDEVHYLSDRERGPVWEEVLIHLPAEIQVVSLSATVSNAQEFGRWLSVVRGDTEVIVSEKRPVPLWQHVMVAGELYDLTDGDEINPSLLSAVHGARRRRVLRSGAVAELDRNALLPAIYFVFSRAGCEDAFSQLANSSLVLTSPAEEKRIRRIVRERVGHLDPADLATLGYQSWMRGLARGVAAHHAGMIPLFKETVEALFSEGLIKVVFATETLALGINMPARSVVLERLDKWDGSQHSPLTPGEYAQLTGRAGRRGIDIEGHAVVLHSPAVRVEDVARLAGTRTYPLRSAFRPTY